ncbi:uncharacterized protein LOC105801183 [Gossypium raimondii]|nr:uncharacterized protein LOC105801183 [Gossypium raimondii]
MDDDQLNLEAVNFYSNLYGEHLGPMRDFPSVAFSCLKDEDFNILNRQVSDEEIKAALFYMAPLKAPGKDGFHALFYQSQWDHVGTLVLVFSKHLALGQVGFVARWNITDNIIIAQEVIHSIRGMQKNRKWMAIKIDLEKAFDLVLWNGVPTQKFRPARGVHQECPLSPYLFILCIEWLGHSIRNAIDLGNWSPIRLSCGGPLLSHLFFADDLILFGHADENQAQVIKNKVTNNTLIFVVEMVHNKLSSWDASQLCLAGRVTLAQYVLLSIPSYFMQIMMVPKGVCDEIERVLRSKYRVPRYLPNDLSMSRCSFLWRSISKYGYRLTGSFSLKSAYEKVCEGTFNLKEWLWAIPWKFHNPHRIRFFIWLALKQCLLTNANRVRCGFWSSSACGLCGHDYKDVLHILRYCNAARGIWDKLIPQQDLSIFYSGSLLDQMRNNFQSHFSSWGGNDCPCFAADGGCVRDHNGEWIIGFAKYLGNCTILETELWGILDELNLILDRRFEKILIQTDSIEAINVILEDSSGNSNSALVRKIHIILRKMEQWKIQYIPREENLIADSLAKSVHIGA